jgi:4-hydroxybenzoate polyprenyltransferase
MLQKLVRRARAVSSMLTAGAGRTLSVHPDDAHYVMTRASEVKASPGTSLSPLDRARAVATLARPRTALPGCLCFCLAASYAQVPLSSRPAIVGLVVVFVLPLIANIHNSLTDLPEDLLGSTTKIELVETVGYRRARHAAVGLAVFAALAACLLGAWQPAVFAWFAVLFTFQYSAPPVRAKARPLLGLVAFAQAVSVPYALGLVLNPTLTLPWVLPPAVAPVFGAGRPDFAMADTAYQAAALFALVSFWFFAKGTFKNFVDYEGDRRAGLATSATVFPDRATAFIPVVVLTIVAYLLPLLLPLAGAPTRMMAVSVLVIPAAINLSRLWRRTGPGQPARVLRDDMTLSSAFAAALLLCAFPTAAAVTVVVVLCLVLVVADLLAFDARRPAAEASRA